MLKMRAGLTFFVLVLNLSFFSSKGWDIGVAVKDHIQLITSSGVIVGNVSDTMTDVSGLAYNQELNRMYFVDNRRLEGSVFELTLPARIGAADDGEAGDVSPIITKQARGSEVKGIVYDPMTGVLYWTNGRGGEVWWLQVTTTGGAMAGQPLFNKEDMLDQIPVGLAIDVCKRYLYWTNLNRSSPTIERSLVSGNQRKTVVSTDLSAPNAVTVDQTSGRIYWVDERDGGKFKVESSDLDGNDRRELYNGKNHQPFALAVAAEFVVWADHISLSLWKIPLNSSQGPTDPQFVKEYSSSPQALVSSEVGRWGHKQCNPIIRPGTVEKKATIIPIDKSEDRSADRLRPEDTHGNYTLCLHGGTYVNIRGKGVCNCAEGYAGDHCETDECMNYCVRGKCSPGPMCHCEEGFRGPRCDRDVCHNFCLQGGSCHIDRDGQPECYCKDGYEGLRCETKPVQETSKESLVNGVNACHNYCIMGDCSVDISGQPRCHCEEGFSGDRCEVNFTQHQELKNSLRDICKEFCVLAEQSAKQTQVPFPVCKCGEFEFLPPLNTEPDSTWSNQSALIGLVVFCALLTVAVAVLAQRVYVLRRRPRVKKRIIVSKNVTPTPMTCRPSSAQECHEITIENCCNMNICETPCYEPEFRQPEATMSRNNRGAKDEKKSLLRNMELPPDDLY